jgi:hypothetical protein
MGRSYPFGDIAIGALVTSADRRDRFDHDDQK